MSFSSSSPDSADQLSQEALARIEKWKRRAGRVNAAAVASALDDPVQRSVIAHVFSNASELADCCLLHPQVLFGALIGHGQQLLDLAAADLGALDRASGPTEALTLALRPIRERVLATTALMAVSGRWGATPAHEAVTYAAERMLDSALHWLIRRAVRHGELPIALELVPQPLQGLFILGGADFAWRETGYTGPLELAVVYDPVRLQDYGISAAVAERAMVHIASELKEAFAAPRKGAPLYQVSIEQIGFGAQLRAALNADDVLYNLGLPAPQPRRAWFASARVVAGDRLGGEVFLARVHERLYQGRFGAVDFATAADDFIRPTTRNAAASQPVPPAMMRLLLNMRLVLGARDESLLTAHSDDVLTAGRESGLLSPQLEQTLKQALSIQRIARDALQLVIGAVPVGTVGGHMARIKHAQATLAGFAEVEKFEEVVQSAEAAAEAAWESLTARTPHETAPMVSPDEVPTIAIVSAGHNLEALGFRDVRAVEATINRWTQRTAGVEAPRRLSELAPGLITELAHTEDPNGAVVRFDRFFKSLPQDCNVFEALGRRPGLSVLFADLFGNAVDVSEAFIAHESLGRDLLRGMGISTPLTADRWVAAHIDENAADNHEADALKSWIVETRARAACDVLAGRLDPGESGKVFTAIAESALRRAYELALGQQHLFDEESGDGLSVVVTGNFGARTLTYDSSLEVVFISDLDARGTHSPESAVRYAAQTRDLIAILADEIPVVHDGDGEGVQKIGSRNAPYQIDLLARPGGSSGELAASLRAYLAYYGGPAAPAEHLALTRARILCGPELMRMKLEAGLGDILTRGRRFDRLAADTDRVRHKQARDIENFNRWELEPMPGGLNDISLIAAALQLRHAAEHPYVLSPDPAQALGALNRAGCLDPDTTDELIESYRFYSRILAVLAITGRPDLNIRRPRPRLQTLIARAAGVSQFSAVEPLIIGHSERTLGHYKRLFLTPQNAVPERRPSSSFRPRSA